MPYTEDRSAWFEGQGLWQHVPESDWRDWNWQLKNRITTAAELEQFMTLTPAEKAGCGFANHKLALAITPYFFNLIDRQRSRVPDPPAGHSPRRRDGPVGGGAGSTRWARTRTRPCRAWCTATRTGCSSS